jgi:hypothetical protein
MKATALIACAAVVLGTAGLTACGGGEREAQSKTPVAEVEVSTTLPESAKSDQALQADADAAAVAASTTEAGAMSTGTVSGDPMSTQNTTTTTTATPQ